MIKYTVNRENHVEMRKGATDWTPSDMINAFHDRTATYEEEIFKTENEQEARAFFEAEKKTCRSYYTDGNIWKLVEFDYISLNSAEYDEDDEFLWMDQIDEYVAPIH